MVKIQIHLKSNQFSFLQTAFATIQEKLSSTFQTIHMNVQKTDKQDYTVIRSPHVHKKSREQFFYTEYHLIFSVNTVNPSLFIYMLKTISFYGCSKYLLLLQHT